MLAEWSNEYKTNMKKYSQEPTITLNLQTKVISGPRPTNQSHPSKLANQLIIIYLQMIIDYIKQLKRKTFDQFKQKAFKVWTLTMTNNEENWLQMCM